MDMEVIQEFSENQCYLNALSHSNQTELDVHVDAVPPSEVERQRVKESFEAVFKEPIGRLVFRAYLCSSGSLDHLVFIDAIEEFDFLPNSRFKLKFAKKIVAQFLDESGSSRQLISLPFHVVEAIRARLESPPRSANLDDLFAAAKHCALLNMSLSSFHGFLHSKYYERLLSFRVKDHLLVNRASFTFIRVLGEGGFGKVFAVSKNDTRALYACKTMSKEKIFAKKREKLIMNEREILSRVNHPFIVSMLYAFQDEDNLYLVLNLMSGGELGFHLNRFKRFPEKMVRFYAAGIVLALEHFHSQRIVYRDLKPENIMLDTDGYMRLTDLGLCAVTKPGEKLKQHCGTRSYMAPEQCCGDEGYETAVDWWALGVTIFHLLTGVNPFSKRYRQRYSRKGLDKENLANKAKHRPSAPSPSAHAASPQAIVIDEAERRERAQIRAMENDADEKDPNGSARSKELLRIGFSPSTTQPSSNFNNKSTRTFGWAPAKDRPEDDKEPNSPESPEARAERYAQMRSSYEETLAAFPWPEKMSKRARSLCEGLLTLNPATRLGYNGAEEVKRHPFFDGISWQKLKERHVAPPFVPERDYVNAKFLEAAAGAFSQSKKKKPNPNQHFQNFDYVRPSVFQEEVMQTMHDKQALVGDK